MSSKRSDLESAQRVGEYLVTLYNADKKKLDQLMYDRPLGVVQKAEKAVFTRLREGWRIVDLHAQQFRAIVTRWLTATLTEDDYEVIATFVGQPESHFAYARRFLSRASLRRVLIEEIKKNKLEPFTRGYEELYHLMALDDCGRLQFKPRWCDFCRRLFLPKRRVIQKSCSRRCSQLLGYQRFVARQKAAAEQALREAWEPHQGSGPGQEEAASVKAARPPRTPTTARR